MAVYTIGLSFSLRVVITFEIEGLGHPEHITRTVCDTKFAAFTSLFYYSYLTLRDLNVFQVKWNTPIFHLKIPLTLPDLGEKPSVSIPDRDCVEAPHKLGINLTSNPEFGKFK
jgi:hypothetical protein